ncbi:MAG: hypothetical protein HW390_2682 [Candidatus Brocadiaceae bacterium]|nr:hypothetical protein [Candidatus Brocadiaceae bacterium]
MVNVLHNKETALSILRSFSPRLFQLFSRGINCPGKLADVVVRPVLDPVGVSAACYFFGNSVMC